jgi:hypothetical protein
MIINQALLIDMFNNVKESERFCTHKFQFIDDKPTDRQPSLVKAEKGPLIKI